MAWTPRRGATPNMGEKAERAAYLLQHSLCRTLAAGRWEATGAVFIRRERRWRRLGRVGEKSYALCPMNARWMRSRSLTPISAYQRLER
jgi:hypothetical protein